MERVARNKQCTKRRQAVTEEGTSDENEINRSAYKTATRPQNAAPEAGSLDVSKCRKRRERPNPKNEKSIPGDSASQRPADHYAGVTASRAGLLPGAGGGSSSTAAAGRRLGGRPGWAVWAATMIDSKEGSSTAK